MLMGKAGEESRTDVEERAKTRLQYVRSIVYK
jgi:hypothetical protein